MACWSESLVGLRHRVGYLERLGEEGKMYHLKLKRPKTLFRFFFYLAALPPLLALLIDGLSKFDKGNFCIILFPVIIGLWIWIIPPIFLFPERLFAFSDFGNGYPVDWRGWAAAIMLYSVVAVVLWLLRGGRIVREKTT